MSEQPKVIQINEWVITLSGPVPVEGPMPPENELVHDAIERLLRRLNNQLPEGFAVKVEPLVPPGYLVD